MPAPITIRALQSAHFGFGRMFSRKLANREELTIAAPTLPVLESIQTQAAAGRLEILTAPTALNFAPVRQKLKNELHVMLGVADDGIVLPVGAELNKLTLGGVSFLLGDGEIDGANAGAQLTALLAALAADTDFAATGAAVSVSKVLVGTTAASQTVTVHENQNPVNGQIITIGGRAYTFVTAVDAADEVKIGADSNATLLNLARAINGTGGTNDIDGGDYYVTGAHTKVTSSASVTDHAITLTARVAGTGGNSITLTTNADHYTVGGATLASGAGPNATALVIIDGSDVADWAAFLAASGVTDEADEVLTSPGVSIVSFTRTTVDTLNANVPVYMSHTVLAADVTRGYIFMDTGLSNLANANTRPTWTHRISRGTSPSVATVAHDGTVTVLAASGTGRGILIENNGSTDFEAGDVVQIFAFGAD